MRLRSLLPRRLRDRLDLHRTAVSRFVERVARSIPNGSLVVDAGAGEGPYRHLFAHTRYVPVDDGRGDARWDYTGLAVSGDLLQLPLRNDVADAVVCTETLEHVTDPGPFVTELARVLRPGGRLFLTAPQAFKEHQQPHDYFRYTRYGLALLIDRAGLQAESIEPEGGYFRFLGDKIQPLHRHLFSKRRRLIWRALFLPLEPFSMLCFTVMAPALLARLDPLDRRRLHTTGYLVVAVKPGPAGETHS
jgi:SAM-dependent methyltransferase